MRRKLLSQVDSGFYPAHSTNPGLLLEREIERPIHPEMPILAFNFYAMCVPIDFLLFVCYCVVNSCMNNHIISDPRIMSGASVIKVSTSFFVATMINLAYTY
jgi:hypothetical protein